MKSETAARLSTMIARAAARSEGIPHGERLRYIHGCRCDQCRKANSQYESDRQKARKAGDWNGVVSARRARSHLRALARKGVGRRSVGAATDISDSILHAIAKGRRPRIRARTERLILAVTPAIAGDAALIPSAATWRLIDQLLDEGYTKTRIAHELGYKTHALQFKRGAPITVRNADRVKRVHEKLTS
jgi:hypothetical protein